MSCKYILPCGYCDKYDVPCKAIINDIKEIQNDFESYKKEHCDHNWESILVVDQGGLRRRTEYRCSKCGLKR